ncbi:hypothetical protein GBAR_LOCUS12706 [Geodia barretti]|uniref:Uncharacterized protein n=1 Tax=Geodia barretti TaxID=519541 RepID=A0AA35WP03_GEOBA|nr:hypothetical protein GBAR_LOCUS12706 [Geodia barretti]
MITCVLHATLNSEHMGGHEDIFSCAHLHSLSHSCSVILSINNTHLIMQVYCGSML